MSADGLPEAVRALLIKVRAGLRIKGDDGSQGSARAAVTVKLGWAEVRGIYAMHSALARAREARDKAQQREKKALRERAAMAEDLVSISLLEDRAVVALLVDVQRILSGEEDSSAALYATKKRVEELLDRSRKRDRRRKR